MSTLTVQSGRFGAAAAVAPDYQSDVFIGNANLSGNTYTTAGNPSGITATDVVILFGYWVSSGATDGISSMPTSFVQRGSTTHINIGGGNYVHYFYGDSNNVDVSGAGNFTLVTAGATPIAGAMAYVRASGITNAATGADGTNFALSPGAGPFSLPALTTTADQALCLCLFASGANGPASDPTGWTSVHATSPTGSFELWAKDQVTAGSTGTDQTTNGGGVQFTLQIVAYEAA